jgi:hypothetical protein
MSRAYLFVISALLISRDYEGPGLRLEGWLSADHHSEFDWTAWAWPGPIYGFLAATKRRRAFHQPARAWKGHHFVGLKAGTVERTQSIVG